MLFFKRPSTNNESRKLTLEKCEPRDLLAADLAVNVTDGGATVEPGAEVKYEASFKNQGDEVAPAAMLSVRIPAGTTPNLEASSEGWACEGQECKLAVGDIDPGTSGNAGLVLAVSDELPTHVRSISVRGWITSEAREFRFRNNSDGSTTPIDRDYNDLRFDITDGGASVAAGQAVTYNIKYSNVSENAAADANIRVELPEGTSFSQDGSSEGWVCEGQTCTLSVGEVGAKGTGEATIAVAVSADLPAEVRAIKVVGGIDSSGVDSRPRNNNDSAWTPVRRMTHDLTLDIHDSRAKTSAGETVAYTVTYGNRGDSTATNATVSVIIPAETTLDAEASSDGWACEDGVCTLAVGDVESKATAESTLALKYADELPADTTKYRVKASIAAESGIDKRLSNNSDDSTTPVRSDKHDLRLQITDGGARVAIGGTVAYAVTYKNTGDAAAEAAVVSVTLPENTTINAAESSEGWTCEEGVCTLAVGNVESGASGEAKIAVQVGSDLADDVRSIRVNANIASPTGVDKYLRNNSDPSYTPIEREYHDLRMKITDNGAKVAAGESVTYAVHWKNRGESPAVGSNITVEIPEFTTFSAEGSSEGWSCEGQTCVLAVGDVAAGGEGNAKLAVTVAEELPANVSRVRVDATMAAEGVDWNPRNNSDPSITPLKRDYHDLHMDFHDEKATVAAGGRVQYFADYQNRGKNVAAGSSIRIELPDFMTFDADSSSEGWACEEGVCTLKVGDVAAGEEGGAKFGVNVAAELPDDLSAFRIWASINADSGADSRSRNNRNIAVTPIEVETEDGGDGEEVAPA